jgi:hypothetical protein
MFALSKALNDLLKQFYYENNFLTMNLFMKNYNKNINWQKKEYF